MFLLLGGLSGLQDGRDSKMPKQSWLCRAAESGPQADPRASKTATGGSGFGRGRQTTVRNGRRWTQRPRRHSSWREGGVLLRSRPVHHRQRPPTTTASSQKGRAVKKPLGSATPEGLGRWARVEAKHKMAAGPARNRTPTGQRTRRRRAAGDATSPASPNVTRRAPAGGPFRTPPSGS